MALFNYIMRKVWLHQTRIGLSLYDVTGQRFLRESDLENYILELIETLPQLDGLEKSFHTFYVCTAVRKFFFFLDPLRTGKIKIQDVLACSFLDDLLELRDQELSKDLQDQNWFFVPSALRVHGQYLNLDANHNGMLSMEELGRYGTGTLTTPGSSSREYFKNVPPISVPCPRHSSGRLPLRLLSEFLLPRHPGRDAETRTGSCHL